MQNNVKNYIIVINSIYLKGKIMSFIEVEKSVKEKEWNMTDLHSHSHYEIYFLISGTRKIFLDDKMYNISAPCLIVIPPYVMHKTEGFAFTRINITVSLASLNQFQTNVLKKLSGKIIALKDTAAELLFPVLQQATEIDPERDKYATDKLYAVFGYIVLILEKTDKNKTFEPVVAKTEKVSPLALKIIDYLSNNFTGDVSLDTLSEKFFISKAGLCSCFKNAMNCSIGEYVLRQKLNKARQLLSSTKKSIEEIADLCGFSSAAYLGLIFKKKVGLSPLQYRKLQASKK